MAEINIERKRNSVLPWVLGVGVLLLLIWGALQLNDRTDRSTRVSMTDQAAEPLVLVEFQQAA